MIVMPIFLLVLILICALSFWDDPCSLEETREKINFFDGRLLIFWAFDSFIYAI